MPLVVLNLVTYHLMRRKTRFVKCIVKNRQQKTNGSRVQNVPFGRIESVKRQIPDKLGN